MKILHTSDWHLGRQFHGDSLEKDHHAILAQIVDAVGLHDPDVLIVAGDIFDRASPPITAVRQFNNFIDQIASGHRCAIVMIAGNHDSGDRIESIATLADHSRALIRGPLRSDEQTLIINDQHGPVAFSALPFGNEFSARECFDDTRISNPSDVLAAQINAARKHVPEGARWVVTAHTFVTNAKPSASERRLVVGGIETVPADRFVDADYVALGHLHRPQSVGADHVRYSGSPLAFGFDETDAEKSMVLVDLEADGSVSTTLLPFKPLRSVRVVTGSHADILASASDAPSNDFFKLVLTDAGALIDPMGKIREFYPNAMVLEYERDREGRETNTTMVAQSELTKPQHVIEEFLTFVRGESVVSKEQPLIDAALTQLAQEGSSS